MPNWITKKIKIFICLFLAFIISSLLTRYVFYPNSITVNYGFIAGIFKKITDAKPVIKEKKITQTTGLPSPLPKEDVVLPTNIPTPTTGFIPTAFPTSTPTAIPTDGSDKITVQPTASFNHCPSVSDQQYGAISIISAPTQNAEDHFDINLSIRGYQETTAELSLIDVGGDVDYQAPQLKTLFLTQNTPVFLHTYQVYDWNSSTNQRSNPINNPKVTLIGIKSTTGAKLLVPQSGYDIGQGNQVMVLYSNQNSITLKYTREDDIIYGYTIHAVDICVDPNLLSLYNDLNNKGRQQLPTLKGGQIFGYAKNQEVKIAIRDTGSFMDPRVRKDWWH